MWFIFCSQVNIRSEVTCSSGTRKNDWNTLKTVLYVLKLHLGHLCSSCSAKTCSPEGTQLHHLRLAGDVPAGWDPTLANDPFWGFDAGLHLLLDGWAAGVPYPVWSTSLALQWGKGANLKWLGDMRAFKSCLSPQVNGVPVEVVQVTIYSRQSWVVLMVDLVAACSMGWYCNQVKVKKISQTSNPGISWKTMGCLMASTWYGRLQTCCTQPSVLSKWLLDSMVIFWTC